MRRGGVQAWTAWRHRLAAAAVAILLAVPTHADSPEPIPAPAGERKLTVLNQGVRPMNEIYVSPQTSDEWGEDRLGARTLESGAFVRIHLGWTRECSVRHQDHLRRRQPRGAAATSMCATPTRSPSTAAAPPRRLAPASPTASPW